MRNIKIFKTASMLATAIALCFLSVTMISAVEAPIGTSCRYILRGEQYEKAQADCLLRELATARNDNARLTLWNGYGQYEKSLIHKYYTRTHSEIRVSTVTIPTPDDISREDRAATCFTRKWEQDEYSGARIHLYSFFQKIDWCVNGKKTKVKKVHGIEYGETYVLFWFYRGLSTSSISGGHGQSYYRRSAQGIFEFCFVEPILCVQQHQILHDNTVQP